LSIILGREVRQRGAGGSSWTLQKLPQTRDDLPNESVVLSAIPLCSLGCGVAVARLGGEGALAIPDFQSLMLPLLELCADGADHSLAASVDALAVKYGLSPEELAQLNPAGGARTFYNRVGWASSYLRAAELLASSGRGRFRITADGFAVLAKPPKRIDIRFLQTVPAYQAREAAKKAKGPGAAATTPEPAAQTPEESFESAYQDMRAAVEEELLARIKAAPPAFFEQLVVDLIVAMGYGGTQADAGEAIGQTGDGGIDGVVKEDRLGLDTVYLQAKRWEGTVGRPVVQSFVGSLEGKHARRGVLITTSGFSSEARAYVGGIEKRVVLIEGSELVRLMFEFGVGVAPVGAPFQLKKLDLDYFEGV
jgi:restriction system protein